LGFSIFWWVLQNSINRYTTKISGYLGESKKSKFSRESWPKNPSSIQIDRRTNWRCLAGNSVHKNLTDLLITTNHNKVFSKFWSPYKYFKTSSNFSSLLSKTCSLNWALAKTLPCYQEDEWTECGISTFFSFRTSVEDHTIFSFLIVSCRFLVGCLLGDSLKHSFSRNNSQNLPDTANLLVWIDRKPFCSNNEQIAGK
jgi:hypothetical protein